MKSDIFIEVWKDVKGYEGLYQVSNLGRVKSFDCYVNYKNIKKRLIKGKLLIPVTIKGHSRVVLYKNQKRENRFVHRLVAEAFKPNPENKPYIDHINTSPWDNAVWNLEWVTSKENQNNPLTLKHFSEAKKGEKNYWYGKYGKDHHRSKPIMQFNLNGNFIKEWECIYEIERELGIKHNNIIKVCKGERKTAGGYVWKYV